MDGIVITLVATGDALLISAGIGEPPSEGNIRIEPEEMVRLVAQDFADYDDAPVDDLLQTDEAHREQNFYANARNAIPEPYRINLPGLEITASADLR